MKEYTLLVLLVISTACSNIESNDKVVELEAGNYNENVDYSSIFSSVEILPIHNDLDSAVWFGEITQYKTYDNIIYLLDEYQSKSITGIDRQGKVKFQFKNVGDGEGEYRNIYAYTVNLEKNQLVIYDRSKSQLMIYDEEDFSFVKSIKILDYLSNIEFLKEDIILCFTEGEAGDDNTMIYSLDLNTGEKASLFKTEYDGIRENFLSFNYNSSQDILTLPFKEEVWKWDSKSQQFILDSDINLKGQEFPEKLLRSREVLELQDFYLNKDYLFYLNNYAESKNMGYGFLYSGFEDRAFLKLNEQTKDIELFDWLDLFENESMPLPNSFYDGQYLAISYLNRSTYKELMQKFPQKNSSRLNTSSSSIEQAYLFKYKLK